MSPESLNFLKISASWLCQQLKYNKGLRGEISSLYSHLAKTSFCIIWDSLTFCKTKASRIVVANLWAALLEAQGLHPHTPHQVKGLSQSLFSETPWTSVARGAINKQLLTTQSPKKKRWSGAICWGMIMTEEATSQRHCPKQRLLGRKEHLSDPNSK